MIQQHAIEVAQHGMTIRGMAYRPSTTRRLPTVLLVHGFTGQRIESGFLFVRLARALCDRGVAAVTFDCRHSGESDGSFEQMLVSGELADVMRMIEWSQGQPFVDRSRLGLVGFSLGGLLAACGAGRFGDCRALALLAPTTVENICRYAAQSDSSPNAAAVTVGPHRLHRDFFNDVRTLDPIGDVTRHARPTLLVQGDGDRAVPPAVSQQFVDALKTANVPTRVVRIDEADHTFSHPDWQHRVISASVDFLATALEA